PLCEIVSKPDMTSPEEAKAYLDEIRQLLLELGVSDCEMQEGSLRCDANVNVHVPQPDGSFVATPIVEVKNMNSFGAVQRARKAEADAQYDEIQPPKPKLRDGPKTAAGWNGAKGVTVVQRRKEEGSDYRPFPEPDLVPVLVDGPRLKRVREELGELPAARR